ncbi:hypothetical protein HY030_02300 [Candidatus Gottesmanbacteria bacterium]|nr:hypothetical protein [Candidatus Gottesmanbacteria bacterium]
MPNLNLRHNLPLFVALVAVTAAIPLTVFVALTQRTNLKSKAGGGPISFASNELKITEIGTIIKFQGGVGRITNSAKIALAPQNEGRVLGFSTPSAVTVTPTITPSDIPTYLLQTEDGRTYHFTNFPFGNLQDYVNKTVLIEGKLQQDVGTKCYPNDSGGQFCYTTDLLPWWPLPNYLGMEIWNYGEVVKTQSSVKYTGILKKADEWNSQFNLFELDTSLLCNTTPCIQPLWSTFSSVPSSTSYYYNPLLVRSSYDDLSNLLGYQIEVSGDEFNFNSYGSQQPATRIFNAKSVKQLTFNKPETKLSFVTDQLQVNPTTEFQTSILMDTGLNKVTAADFQLYFDPSRIQLLSIVPNESYFPQILTPSAIDNTYGTARIVVGSGPNKTITGLGLQVINVKGRTKNLTGDAWISFAYGTKVAAYDFKYNVLTESSPLKINVPNLIPGDLDNNGKVDIFDYNLLVQNFDSSVCNNVADIDNNCRVDIFDYNVLVQNFGRTVVNQANSINWSTSYAKLSASDFYIRIGDKKFYGKDATLNSSPGNYYTTLEATWHENDVEMRMNMYFQKFVDTGMWEMFELRTYNGNNPGDWIYYKDSHGNKVTSTPGYHNYQYLRTFIPLNSNSSSEIYCSKCSITAF